jgi:hypothetical protein
VLGVCVPVRLLAALRDVESALPSVTSRIRHLSFL